MKKNITINLYGTLYAIDEDAYQLLLAYESSLKSYFSKTEGGDEIVDDVLHRIAELLDQLRASGIQAISIEHVQSIISRIGEPEQMASSDDETPSGNATPQEEPSTSQNQTPHQRRLFRDPNDQMLGGVLSGIAHYFNSDPLCWRLAFILLCFLSFFTASIIYLIFWLVIPTPASAEDFLLMNGQRVTLSSIAQNLSQTPTQPSRTAFERILVLFIGFFKIILYFLGIILALVFAALMLVFFIFIIMGIVGIASGSNTLAIFYDFDPDILTTLPLAASLWYWCLVIFGLFASSIPIYLIIHHIISRSGRTEPLSPTKRIIWILLFILTILLITFSAGKLDNALEGKKTSMITEITIGK